MKRALPLLLLLAPFSFACTANLSGEAGESESNGSNNPGSGPGKDGTSAESADVTPARLLTDIQYNNAVAALFGDESRPLGEQIRALGELYDNDSSALSASPRTVEIFEEVATRVSDRAFASGKVAFECASGESEDSCVTSYVDQLGLKVFRRPPTEEEKSVLTGLFTELRSDPIGDSAEDAAKGVLSAMLQMPGFLYQTELGESPGEGSRLTGYEIASRLAFALTNAPPDDALLAAAADGRLDDVEGVRAEAKRLLDSAASREGLLHFVSQWLGIEDVANMNRDATLFPEYSPELGQSMGEETRRFFEDVFWKQRGEVRDLFTADYSFVDDKLAALYGLSGDFGSEFQKVTLPEERLGILTQAAYLTAHTPSDETSPIARGVYTNRKIMCTPMGSVPNNVGALPKEVPEGGSVRDLLEAHSSNPCATCHKYIDPVGLSFENFDAVGGYRTEYDNGAAVDATGTVKFKESDVPVDGGVEFSESLANSDKTTSCFTEQLLSYMLGRTVDDNDRGTIEKIASETQNLEEIVLAVVSSEPFLHRDVPAPEACE